MEKFVLPSEVEETSGLIFLNGKIITHNDSGDDPNLYEIDPENGEITRVVTLENATNIDWEDLDQDDTYIYIADIGNNNGNREDLKIYEILKSDFISSTNVTSQEITFSYEDQTDFSSQPNNSNFDAEAICVYQDQILIFTK
ncbi:MAG: T9SS C-terminal target domain-containing protein, partial [Flavobacteriaceae bacterium]|nr:T9SS C-terminal target domain-containing protein [Flavobacteriaceae bacterium]